MYGNQKVSLAGKVIITVIFLLTSVLPTVFTVMFLTGHAGLGYTLTFALVRFMFYCILYYFMMAGHSWATWIMSLIMMIAVALVVGVGGKDKLTFVIAYCILYIPSIIVLLCFKIVQPVDPDWGKRRSRSRHLGAGKMQ